jgi:hypothetical protein
MSDISKRAEQLANEHPPGVVIENLFLGLFTVIGWVLGRSWFYLSKFVFLIYLAFQDGYIKGGKVKQKPPPPAEIMQPQQIQQLMNDGRTIDTVTTPFGVPFGPNVQAWSEPG